MAAYHWVYDSRHLQADCKEPGYISSGTLRSVIKYVLPLTCNEKARRYSPSWSTSLASLRASEVARSVLAAVTARMMELGLLMYRRHISRTWISISSG